VSRFPIRESRATHEADLTSAGLFFFLFFCFLFFVFCFLFFFFFFFSIHPDADGIAITAASTGVDVALFNSRHAGHAGALNIILNTFLRPITIYYERPS